MYLDASRAALGDGSGHGGAGRVNERSEPNIHKIYTRVTQAKDGWRQTHCREGS